MGYKISGLGIYLPPKIEYSKDTALKINKDEKWIIKKTGVYERRVSDIDVDEMGAEAAKKALLNNQKPDLIINASGVPKQSIPDTSVFFQKALKLEGVPCFSIHATCLSFLVALRNAISLIDTDTYNRILIISADRGTLGRNFNEPESASLLGDGAASILIEKTNSKESILKYWKMHTWSSAADLTEVRGGGTRLHPQDFKTKPTDNLFTMNGPAIYKIARIKSYKMLLQTLKNNKLKKKDIDWIVPHQASGKAITAYHSIGGFKESKVVNIISKTGNCVAASLPIAFITAVQDHRIKKGDLIYFTGTGAGLSMASCLLKY